MECEFCGKAEDRLYKLVLNNDDIKEVCEDCYGRAEAIGDYEYDRQREEGISHAK